MSSLAGAAETVEALRIPGFDQVYLRLGHIYLNRMALTRGFVPRLDAVKRALDAFSYARELGAGAESRLGVSNCLVAMMGLERPQFEEMIWMSERAILEAEEAVTVDPADYHTYVALARALLTKASRCPEGQLVPLLQKAMMSLNVACKLRPDLFPFPSHGNLVSHGMLQQPPAYEWD